MDVLSMKLIPLLFCAYAAAAEAQPAFPGAPSNSMCSASALCYLSSFCGTQGCTKPWSAGPLVCGVLPIPCPACSVGQPKLFSSKHHECADAAWLSPALCRGSLAQPAVLQLLWRGSMSHSLPTVGCPNGREHSQNLTAGEKQTGITHGSVRAWAGTTRLQVGQGSLLSHPPCGLPDPPQFPSPTLAKAAPPCSLRLWVAVMALQKEQSFSVSLKSLES